MTPGSLSVKYMCHHQLTANVVQNDVIEAHWYFVDIGQTDREQIRSRMNNNDCRTFQSRRPLSTAYKRFAHT